MDQFSGKTAVITGAASGIGLATSQLFAGEGMSVVLADVEAPLLEKAAGELEAQGHSVHPVVCDVSDPASTDALANAARERYGNVHILFNNAGVFSSGASWECSARDYEWIMAVNVHGVANGIRSFVPAMIESGEQCHVVTTASMAALTTMPGSSVYCTSKAAALSLTECLYKELQQAAPQIGVSVLCPELINTGIAHAGRNRPADFVDGDITDSDFQRMTDDAITEATAGGLDPMVMAERVLAGIKAEKFYLLAVDYWKDIAMARQEEIRNETNPTMEFGG